MPFFVAGSNLKDPEIPRFSKGASKRRTERPASGDSGRVHMAKPQEPPDEEPEAKPTESRPSVRPLFASSNTKDCREGKFSDLAW